MDCTPLEATIPTLQSAVKRSISDLPVPKIANLQEDQKNCHICMEPLLLLLFPFLSLHQATLTKGASTTPMRSRLGEELHINVAHISWEKVSKELSHVSDRARASATTAFNRTPAPA